MKLIENLLSGKFKSKKEAMIAAGYAVSTATKQPPTTIGSNRLKIAMQKALEEQNITSFRLAKKIHQGLEATKVISAIVVAPDGEGMKEANSIIEVPDFFARHKYLATALELRGDLPAKRSEDTLTTESHEQRLERLREKIGRQL